MIFEKEYMEQNKTKLSPGFLVSFPPGGSLPGSHLHHRHATMVKINHQMMFYKQ
jgi:hypothetical protein